VDTEGGDAIGDSVGDSGKGVDLGDSGICTSFDVGAGWGDVLAEALGVVPLDASPMANFARSLSSRLDFINGAPG
jgi:hypothetical protein